MKDLKRNTLWASMFVLASISFWVCAQEIHYPDYVGWVNDFADVISPAREQWMTALASELQQKTTAQMAIVTVRTAKPLTIEDYAWRLFERWGIGQKGEDNGVLLLVAIQDRKLRIETGYGLEGPLPDAACDQIIRKVIVPYFKQEDYSEGIAAGAAAIAAPVAKEYGVDLSSLEGTPAAIPTTGRSPTGGLFALLFPLIVFILILRFRLLGLLLLASGRRSGGFWYGSGAGGMKGGFGGGFGGFGGGMSGGGGASGGW